MTSRKIDTHLTTFGLRWLFVFWITVGTLLFSSGCSDDKYEQLPDEIQQFVDQYYPGLSVTSYHESAGVYTVNLENSATLVFTQLRWTTVDGNGNTLPQQFLFDQFPQGLYDYVVNTDNLSSVYSVSRLSGIYTVTFHNYTVAYNVATGEITPVTDGSTE